MRQIKVTIVVINLVALSSLRMGLAQTQSAPASSGQASPSQAQSGDPQPTGRSGLGARAALLRADPRIQNRTYLFSDTKEQLPYTVFVSSKVSKDKKNPLIVALHGLGGNSRTLLRGEVLDLAEQGGYIVVGPMGYNSSGWYGIPAAARVGRRVAAPNASVARGSLAARAGLAISGGTAETDNAKVRELSEKDVMNVLTLVRKEFNVDDRRTYLMGHSMGGAGALYLGEKHASEWAAIAPAAFALRPTSLESIKDMPVIIVQGDADTMVPVAGTRRWADELKALNMAYEYHEIPGGTHGSVVSTGMPEIFKFFAKHSKPEKH